MWVGVTNVNIFHEDFFWGCIGFLWSAWIGHCHMDLSEVFIKKFIGILVKLQLVKAKE